MLKVSGRTTLLIKAEKAAGPMEIPQKSLFKVYCWFPITKCVKCRDCSSSGSWLCGMFILAVVKFCLFILVWITWIGSIGKLNLDSSMSELRYLASKTTFNDAPLARIITGCVNVFPFGCSSVLSGEMFSFYSKLTSNLLTLSFRWIGTLLVCCFLKITSSFRGRCNDEITLPTSNLDVT